VGETKPAQQQSIAATEGATQNRKSRLARGLAAALWLGVLMSLLLLAYAYVVPDRFRDTRSWWVALSAIGFFTRVFQFHIGVACLAAMLLAILIRRGRLAQLAAIVAAGAMMPTVKSILPKHAPVVIPGDVALRVMQMNMRFDNRDMQRVGAVITQAKPDVLFIEEYTPQQARQLAPVLEPTYPYRIVLPHERFDGIAVYSRFPLTQESAPETGSALAKRTMRAAMDMNGREVAVYAVHLNSPQTLSKIAANRVHTADLCDELASEKRPVLCAGDFNFNETTPEYAAMARVGLTSTHELAGHGRGSTWSRLPRYRRYLPGVRIDHILLSGDWACSRSETSADYNSDHVAVIADVILRGR
jgi:endonuclease/exonuclease/phosphatase (EEP) superfamily protein YafD